MSFLNMTFTFLGSLVRERLELAAENLALRQQLAVQQRSVKRPKLRQRDRIFWVWLSASWRNWQSALLIVKPDTVVQWHRQGFKLYWTWKSRRCRKGGRPKVDRQERRSKRWRKSRDGGRTALPS